MNAPGHTHFKIFPIIFVSLRDKFWWDRFSAALKYATTNTKHFRKAIGMCQKIADRCQLQFSASILHPDKPLAELWYVRLSYRQVTTFVSDVLMNLAAVV
jgi:hypothetical protein